MSITYLSDKPITCDENLENDYELSQCDKDFYTNKCNKFLLKKELVERNCLLETPNKNVLYPNLNDVNFNIKISNKKEFNDNKYDGVIHTNIKEYSDKLANSEFTLAPHQDFVKNFLSMETPYNSLLLFHGLGTGKTLSSIGVCEEMREYMKKSGSRKKIIIVASVNVQDNFKLQLFDERKLELTDGVWSMKGGIGNKLLNDANPTNIKNIQRETIISKVKDIINVYYLFLGYIEFANYIVKIFNNKPTIKKVREEFDDRLIVIDEIHNIRKTEDNDSKKVAVNVELLVKTAKNMRLLLLSATPMYNSYKEIIWLLNLMNTNDRRGRITVGDIFDKNGNLKKDGGVELLIRKATGYISFIRGENPYTFPYRVYPIEFAKKNTFPFIHYPNYQLNLKKIKDEDKKRILSLYLVKIGNCSNCGKCQYCIYKYIMFKLREKKEATIPSFENMESFGYNILQIPMESLIISYPYEGIETQIKKIPKSKYSNVYEESFKEKEGLIETSESIEPIESIESIEPIEPIEAIESIESIESSESSESLDSNVSNEYSESNNTNNVYDIEPRELTGKIGLKRMMNFKDIRTPQPVKGEFSYKENTLKNYGRIFSYNEIGKYSSKIKTVLDNINIKKINGSYTVADGVILIYSEYIDGGLIPVALALEEMGFTRYGDNTKPLFEKMPSKIVDVRTMSPPVSSKDFMPARYSMITGDKRISPNNIFEVKGITNENNKDGHNVKVVLISRAGSEGIDFKFIRQVHILEPWYNMNRIEQIIGRGVRNFSHKDLPFEKRNVQIFLYGTILDKNEEESVDLYVYRVAEYKAIQIGKITRILKESAVDCIINHEQTNFTQENMLPKLEEGITQQLSNGHLIHDFKIGDAPFSPACDYMATCNYNCIPNKKLSEENLNEDTYNEYFINLNTERIIQKIKLLMRERFFYTKQNMINLIQIPKKYSIAQIYAALTKLIDDDKEIIIDKYNRSGCLINIGEYYLFQPNEISYKNISIYDRSVPVNYKHDSIIFNGNQNIVKPVINDIEYLGKIQLKTNKIYDDLQNNYNIVIEYSNMDNVEWGDENWYKHCGIVIKKITTKATASFGDIPRDVLLELLVAHLIETLLYHEKIELLNYIYSIKKDMNELEIMIKQYFDEISIKEKGVLYFILYDDKTMKLITVNKKKEIGESFLFDELKNTPKMKKEDSYKNDSYNSIVGFMGYSKNKKDMVFKTKNMLSKRDTGARCDEAGKAKTIKKINDILGFEFFTKNNTQNIKDKTGKIIQETTRGVELCIHLEFMLRYFDRIKKNNKIWFVIPEMAIYHNLYNV